MNCCRIESLAISQYSIFAQNKETMNQGPPLVNHKKKFADAPPALPHKDICRKYDISTKRYEGIMSDLTLPQRKCLKSLLKEEQKPVMIKNVCIKKALYNFMLFLNNWHHAVVYTFLAGKY